MERATNPRTRIAIPWTDLPPELLLNISKRLPSEIETLRFRAVCHSWRSSTPPFKFPTIKLPFPFDAAENPGPGHSGAYFTLTERVVYRIQLPRGKSPDFWIVKLEHAGDGKVRVINPVTHRRIEILPAVGMPKVLNLLDFDVSEVCKGYALRYVNPSKESDDYYDYRLAKKVAFTSNVENGEYVVMAIDLRCKLWSITSGGDKWSRCSPLFNNFSPGMFYDVASINGQLHVADASGIIWHFDSKFRWWRKGRYMGRLPLKRRLVELCNGELVLVQEMRKAVLGPLSTDFSVEQPFVDIETYAQVLKKWMDVSATHGCFISQMTVPSLFPPSKSSRRLWFFTRIAMCFLKGISIMWPLANTHASSAIAGGISAIACTIRNLIKVMMRLQTVKLSVCSKNAMVKISACTTVGMVK